MRERQVTSEEQGGEERQRTLHSTDVPPGTPMVVMTASSVLLNSM